MHASKKPSLYKGIGLTILAFLFVSLVAAFVKGASTYVSTFTILFFQNLICFLLNLPCSIKKGIKTEHPYLQLTRSLSGLLCILCFFYAIKFIPLANGILLQNTAPLWIPFIIWVWFKKKVPSHLWWSLIIGFAGIVLILKPGKELFDSMTVLALVAGLLLGIAMLAIRQLALVDHPSKTLFYYFLMVMIVSFPFAIGNLSAAFSWKPALLLLGSGISFYYGNFFMIKAFGHAKVSTLSPFSYVCVLFSAILDWIFWHHIPDLISLIGMVLVIIGGIFSILLEKKYEKKYV